MSNQSTSNTAISQGFTDLATRFHQLEVETRQGASTNRASGVVRTSAKDQAGALIAAAVDAGLLPDTQMVKLVAWHAGSGRGRHPFGQPATYARCDLNLFGDVSTLIMQNYVHAPTVYRLANMSMDNGTDQMEINRTLLIEDLAASAWVCEQLAQRLTSDPGADDKAEWLKPRERLAMLPLGNTTDPEKRRVEARLRKAIAPADQTLDGRVSLVRLSAWRRLCEQLKAKSSSATDWSDAIDVVALNEIRTAKTSPLPAPPKADDIEENHARAVAKVRQK